MGTVKLKTPLIVLSAHKLAGYSAVVGRSAMYGVQAVTVIALFPWH